LPISEPQGATIGASVSPCGILVSHFLPAPAIGPGQPVPGRCARRWVKLLHAVPICGQTRVSDNSSGRRMMSAAQVDEREARRVAEESREATWQQPSFAKELY